MFSTIGIWLMVAMVTFSALANLYDAGKYSNPNSKDKVQKAKDVRNASATSFVFGVIVLAIVFLL
jgi:hypothetical protein